MSNVFQLLGVLPGPLLDQTVRDIHELEIAFYKVRMVNKCPQVFPENSAAFVFLLCFFFCGFHGILFVDSFMQLFPLTGIYSLQHNTLLIIMHRTHMKTRLRGQLTAWENKVYVFLQHSRRYLLRHAHKWCTFSYITLASGVLSRISRSQVVYFLVCHAHKWCNFSYVALTSGVISRMSRSQVV